MSRQPVLFVDDQPQVLNGIKRMLRSKNSEWDILYANNGAEALALLEKVPATVIVTDMKMPQMTGAELLFEIKRRYPDTMRIVLSGYFEQENIYRSGGTAHAYLMKPCSSDTIVSVIEQALELKKLFAKPELVECIQRLPDPPVAPAIDNTIEELIRSRTLTSDSVAEALDQNGDGGTLVKEFLSTIPKEKMGLAISLNFLGLERIRALLIRQHVLAQYSDGLPNSVQMVEWGRKISRLAEALTMSVTDDGAFLTDSYCAGLLSGIGVMILYANDPAKYIAVKGTVQRTNVPLIQAEQDAFGVNHGLLAAYYLHRWGFSNSIVEACAFHHELHHYRDTPLNPGLMVHLAETLQIDNHGIGLNYEPGAETSKDYLHRHQLTDHLPEWRRIVTENI